MKLNFKLNSTLKQNKEKNLLFSLLNFQTCARRLISFKSASCLAFAFQPHTLYFFLFSPVFFEIQPIEFYSKNTMTITFLSVFVRLSDLYTYVCCLTTSNLVRSDLVLLIDV